MTKYFIAEIIGGKGRSLRRLGILLPGLVALALTAGCQSEPLFPMPAQPSATNVTEAIILREGDVLKISFPGNPNLNKVAPIRRDGLIALDLVGEVKAAGKTPKQLEADLVELYSTQLVS